MHISPGLKAADYSNQLGQIRELTAYPYPIGDVFKLRKASLISILTFKQSKGQLISSKQLWVGRGGNLGSNTYKRTKEPPRYTLTRLDSVLGSYPRT